MNQQLVLRVEYLYEKKTLPLYQLILFLWHLNRQRELKINVYTLIKHQVQPVPLWKRQNRRPYNQVISLLEIYS